MTFHEERKRRKKTLDTWERSKQWSGSIISCRQVLKKDRKLRNVLGRKHVGNIGADISEGKIRKKYNLGNAGDCLP